MTTDRPKRPLGPLLWLVIGLVLLVYGLWQGLTGGGFTAWLLAVAGAANVAVSVQTLRKGPKG